MYNIKLIKNYANALHSYASEKKITEFVLAQLELINQTINDDDNLKHILQSPIIDKNIKSNILLKIVGEFDKQGLLTNFLLTMMKNSRGLILGEIYKQYKILLDKDKNIEKIYITSAQILNQDDQEVVINYLKNKMASNNIEVEFNVSSTIIGGILIRYGNNVIDLSILEQINKINKISQ